MYTDGTREFVSPLRCSGNGDTPAPAVPEGDRTRRTIPHRVKRLPSVLIRSLSVLIRDKVLSAFVADHFTDTEGECIPVN